MENEENGVSQLTKTKEKMKNFNDALCRNLLDSILPVYGNPRANVPVWDDGQKMFIVDEYEAPSGNRYYQGFRFCQQLAIVEKVGMYHNWTYINSMELYVFDGTKLKLVQKREYGKVFRSDEFVRQESQSMLEKYLEATFKAAGEQISAEEVTKCAGQLVEQSFKSLLDSDFPMRIAKILPALECK